MRRMAMIAAALVAAAGILTAGVAVAKSQKVSKTHKSGTTVLRGAPVGSVSGSHHKAARSAPKSKNVQSRLAVMDRNHDGVVSRREFKGSKSEFSRLDTNHDGKLTIKKSTGKSKTSSSKTPYKGF